MNTTKRNSHSNQKMEVIWYFFLKLILIVFQEAFAAINIGLSYRKASETFYIPRASSFKHRNLPSASY